MKILYLLVLATLASAQYSYPDNYADEKDAQIDNLERSLRASIRQNILQQLYLEEKVRSDGDSGVKQIRGNQVGTRNYYSEAHMSNAFLAIHNHANHVRTIGMGEFIGVLNGVEFRTRHNDYKMVMPSTSSKEYQATENVPFPEVPQSVLDQPTIDGQIEEMRKYFEAFHKQNTNIRDYTPYFKPTLCFLEGAWTESSGDIDESFPSDRHWIEAKTWHALQEKIRFTGYSGSKDGNENFAYLPTAIWNINGTFPVTAQWNYRIVCHPLKDNLPLNRFRPYDDLQGRMKTKKTIEEYAADRMARFQINVRSGNSWNEGSVRPQTLDRMFAEIPGYDNYGAYLEDEVSGSLAYSMLDDSEPLNAAYYHRFYKLKENDAMGNAVRTRGFADSNLFVAVNTQDKVMGMTLYDEETKWDLYTPPNPEDGHQHRYRITYEDMLKLRDGDVVRLAKKAFDEGAGHEHIIQVEPIWGEEGSTDNDFDVIGFHVYRCKDDWSDSWDDDLCVEAGHNGTMLFPEKKPGIEQKMSYAIPLEVIYLTPLSSWNPYNLTNWENDNAKPNEGGRNGNNPETALNGVSDNKYYLTPAEFYTGEEIDDDPADTSGGDVWVADQEGIPRPTRAAGHYIFLPEIEGVGIIRQRYPIAPLHGDGNPAIKEIEALKDLILRPVTNQHMFYEDVDGIGTSPTQPPQTRWDYVTPPAYSQFESHRHSFTIDAEGMEKLLNGEEYITGDTEESHGHVHDLKVIGFWDETGDNMLGIRVIGCRNSASGEWQDDCWDGHGGDAVEV